jgi:hypothetical protein
MIVFHFSLASARMITAPSRVAVVPSNSKRWVTTAPLFAPRPS